MTWREDLAWAAGIIDGEGCFDTSPNYGVGHKRETPRIIARLTVGQGSRTGEPQMLTRFHDLFGGAVSRPYVRKDRPDATPMYFWTVGSFHKVQAVLAMTWPWLGDVKRKQAASVLARATPPSRPHWGSRSH